MWLERGAITIGSNQECPPRSYPPRERHRSLSIITIEGDHEINEIHFNNVQVPVDNLVGEEGKGWTYGKVLLQHERAGAAGVARSRYRLGRLRARAEQPADGNPGLAADRNFMRRIAATEVALKALEFTELRTLAAVAAGRSAEAETQVGPAAEVET